MLCKKSLSNPVRFGRKQRQIVDFCAVVYLGSSKGSFFISKGLATFFRLEWCRGILPTVVSVSPNTALLGFCSLQYLLTVLSLFFTCQCVKHCHASYSTPQCLWNSYSSLLRMTYPSTSVIFRQTYTRTYPGNRLP